MGCCLCSQAGPPARPPRRPTQPAMCPRLCFRLVAGLRGLACLPQAPPCGRSGGVLRGPPRAAMTQGGFLPGRAARRGTQRRWWWGGSALFRRRPSLNVVPAAAGGAAAAARACAALQAPLRSREASLTLRTSSARAGSGFQENLSRQRCSVKFAV